MSAASPPAAGQPPDDELDQFVAAGHRILDWIAAYLRHPERYPVLSRLSPGDLARALPGAAPTQGEPLDRALDDFERLIVPGITHWNHPGFLAYFGITGSPPGILGELLSAALNVNGMLWRTSPAATELEEVTLGWLRDALGLPSGWFGVLTDTASTSSLVALGAARDRARPAVRREGLYGAAPLRLYCSEQAHSSIDKAAIFLGLGLDHLVKVPVDDGFRLDPRALEQRIAADRSLGFVPFAVVATAGTTSTTSVDPLPAIGEVCARERLWLHVDAAYGGAAGLAPELRWVLDGAEQADSLVVNPHKWLQTPVDCSALYLKDRETLRRAASLVPDYLKTAEAGVTNYMDYGFQLGRRFRALKLWLVLRAYGTDGLAARIREHVHLAHELARRIDREPGFERLAPVPLSVVCLRARPADLSGREAEPRVAAYLDRLNAAVLEQVNRSGEVMLSSTRLRGQTAIRIAIGNARTGEAHIRRAEELLRQSAVDLDRELRPRL